MRKANYIGVFLALLGFVSLLFSHSMPAKAGDALDADEIKELLLRPQGWAGTWEGIGIAGFFDIVFAANGNQIKAYIVTADRRGQPYPCEREVMYSFGVVQWDSCLGEKGISLKFDPNDGVYAFKGASQRGLGYRLRAK